MAIWLNPYDAERPFSSDGNWTSTTVNEDGSITIKTVRNHVVVSETTTPAESDDEASPGGTIEP